MKMLKGSSSSVAVAAKKCERESADTHARRTLGEGGLERKWSKSLRLKNADAVQVTHVIIDRRKNGEVVWRCYGIPAGSTASEAQEGSSKSLSAPDGDTEQKDAKAYWGHAISITVTRLVDDANQLL